MITANTDELQVISSIEMPASNNSLDGGGRKKAGLPKGSTNDSQASSAQQMVLEKNAAVEFDKLKKESHEANKQVRKGAYCAIITDAKQQFNLPDDAKMS